MNDVRESLRKICQALNEHRVEYMLIGGVAVGFHGFPRSTADIDFWYNPTASNFSQLILALKSIGVDDERLNLIVFDPNKTYLRIPQLGFRTEFLPKIEGVNSYPTARKSAVKTQLDGVDVFILGYDDLLKSKIAVNRDVDQLDVKELEKRRKEED
jgi:predicted nucleotidyltransferase